MSNARKLAKELKNELLLHLDNIKLQPQDRTDAYRNPIALIAQNLVASKKLSQAAENFRQDLRRTAKLIITPENLTILKTYFADRSKETDKLAELYKELTFEEFILRLANQRYKQVYMDDRVVIPRKSKDFNVGKGQGADFIFDVGSAYDNKNDYQRYITLEEMMLSPLVLHQVTSVVIGTGNRSSEKHWDVIQEFNQSIDISTFSYPEAAEFPDGRTLHFDLLNLVIPANKEAYESSWYKELYLYRKTHPALAAASQAIYGELASTTDFQNSPAKYLAIKSSTPTSSTLSIIDNQPNTPFNISKPGYYLKRNTALPSLEYACADGSFISIDLTNIIFDHNQTLADYLETMSFDSWKTNIQSIQQAIENYHNLPHTPHNAVPRYYLNKIAYINRTKNVLKSVLVGADRDMATHGLGTTFQLKGLGLGAFGFSAHTNNVALEQLYIEALMQTLGEIKLFYIKCINLINLPSIYQVTLFENKETTLFDDNIVNGIRIITTVMHPTTKAHAATIGETGGTVFCGDSGSQIGNEGNCGFSRMSSDDPAQHYTLLDPYILHPSLNPFIRSSNAIKIADEYLQQLTPLIPQIKALAENIEISESIVQEDQSVTSPLLPPTVVALGKKTTLRNIGNQHEPALPPELHEDNAALSLSLPLLNESQDIKKKNLNRIKSDGRSSKTNSIAITDPVMHPLPTAANYEKPGKKAPTSEKRPQQEKSKTLSQKELINNFISTMNRSQNDKDNIKVGAIKLIALLDPAHINILFDTLKNKNIPLHISNVTAHRFKSIFRKHESTICWAAILEAMKVRLMKLLLLDVCNEVNFYNQLTKIEHFKDTFNAILSAHKHNHWFTKETKTIKRLNTILNNPFEEYAKDDMRKYEIYYHEKHNRIFGEPLNKPIIEVFNYSRTL